MKSTTRRVFFTLSISCVILLTSCNSSSDGNTTQSQLDPINAKDIAKNSAISSGVNTNSIIDNNIGDTQSKILGDITHNTIILYSDSVLPSDYSVRNVSIHNSIIEIVGTTEKKIDTSNYATIFYNYDLTFTFNNFPITKDGAEYRIWGTFKHSGYKWDGNTDNLQTLFGTTTIGGALLMTGANYYSFTYDSKFNANFPPYAPAHRCDLTYIINDTTVTSGSCNDYRSL